MNRIVIVDYGMGNLRSVAQAMMTAAPEAQVSIENTPQALRNAHRIVLPGQGAMRDCMACLHQSGLREAVLEAASNKPLLGVCVGEQMLLERSDEGDVACLGLIPGQVKKFDLVGQWQADGSRFKVPQMGWNRVKQTRAHVLWMGVPDEAYFYFVHSYYAAPAKQEHIMGSTEYGAGFASAIARDNIFATQFHPEKSAAAGLQIYANFAKWAP